MLQILVATLAQLATFHSALDYDYAEYENSAGPAQLQRADGTASDFNCTKPGRFPNPESCSQYFLCVQINASVLYLSFMTCPNALVFDPDAQYCTTTDNYVCPTTTTTTTTTTATTTTP